MSDSAVPGRRDIPYPVDVKADRAVFWCSCGLSKKQPWCDGSHSGTSFTPLNFRAPASFRVVLCGCKKTRNPPYCDGTHAYSDAAVPTTKTGGNDDGPR